MSTAIAIAKEYASLIDLLETSDELTPEMIADTLEGMEGELGDKLDAMMVICRNLQGNANTCAEECLAWLPVRRHLKARKKQFGSICSPACKLLAWIN